MITVKQPELIRVLKGADPKIDFLNLTAVSQFNNIDGVRGTQAMRPSISHNSIVMINEYKTPYGRNNVLNVIPIHNSLKDIDISIFKLCTKLDILSLSYKEVSNSLSGTKRFFKNYDKNVLPRKQLCKFLQIRPPDWSRMSSIWKSFGSLVLANPELRLIKDVQLKQSILSFKRRFILYFTRGSKRLRRLVSKLPKPEINQNNLDSGRRYRRAEVYHYSLLIDELRFYEMEEYIKSLSTIIQRKLFNNSYDYDDLKFKRLFSYSSNGYPLLSIFGGHLRRYRRILQPNVDLEEQDYLALATFRTIGRSLPPSSNYRVKLDACESIGIWKSSFNFGNEVYKNFVKNTDAVMVNLRFSRMPLTSHLSLTSSSTYDSSVKKGGMTAELRKYFRLLNGRKFTIEPTDHKYNILIDAFYNKCTSIDCLNRGLESFSPLKHLLYRDLTAEDRLGFFQEIYKFPEIKTYNAGHMALLIASALCIEFGSYEPKPDVFVKISGLSIPFWYDSSKLTLLYKPTLIPVRMAASATAGCKTRIVTINKLCFSIIGKYLHFMVKPILLRSELFQSGQRLLWPSSYRFKPYGMIYSQDLKNSTDYFSHQIVYLIWQHVAKYVRYANERHPFLIWKDIISYKRTISVPKYLSDTGEAYSFKQERGSLMGDAMSFMTLSLFGVIFDRMVRTLNRTYYHSPGLLLGDDYLTVLENYDYCVKASALTSSLGLVLSKKHGYSARAGVFAEQLISIVRHRLCFLDLIKLRLLTGVPSTIMGDRRVSFIGKGKDLLKIYSYTGNQTLKSVISHTFWQEFKRYYGNLNILLPYFLPTTLGGLGFPMKPGKFVHYFWKYIHYFEHFDTDHIDPYERLIESLRLRYIYRNSKKGLGDYTQEAITILGKYLRKYKVAEDYHGEFHDNLLYHRSLLKSKYLDLISDEPTITGKTEYEETLEKESIYTLDRIIDIFDRIYTFDRGLRIDSKPKEVTLNTYLRKARKFWRPRVVNRPCNKGTLPDLYKLEGKIKGYSDYFIYISKDTFISLDLASSMRVSYFDPVGNQNYTNLSDYVGVFHQDVKTPVIVVEDYRTDYCHIMPELGIDLTDITFGGKTKFVCEPGRLY